MALHSDQIISNLERAVAAVGAGEGYLIVYRDGIDTRGGVDVQGWQYRILDQHAFTLEEGNDLYTPWFGDRQRTESDAVKAMSTLISFLLAFAEANQGEENSDLFGSPVRDWVECCDGDLQILQSELEAMLASS